MEDKKLKIGIWSRILYGILGAVMNLIIRLLAGFRLKTDPEVKEWKRSKKSFVILCAHHSEADAVVMLAATFPRYARFVVGAQQLYKGFKGKILRQLQVISKKQFTPDIKAIKEMIRTVKAGYILGMMPEGRVSMDGTSNPIDDSTAKLLKKLGVPVAVLKPHGTYFLIDPYGGFKVHLGKIGGDLKCLFDEEEIKELPGEEIMDRLNEAISFNAFEETRGTGRKYGSKNKPWMNRISNILYRCPKCGKLYTMDDDGRKLFCTSCGMTMGVTREMFFIPEEEGLPDNPADWNKGQLEFEHGFWSDPSASIGSGVRKSVMELGKDIDFGPVGERDGKIILSREGLNYEDPEETLDVPLASLPGVSADYSKGFIVLYQGDLIRRFYLDDRRMTARFVNSLMVLKGLK